MLSRTALFAAALLTALAIVSPANAQGGVKVGVLTCQLDGGFGLIVGSRKTLSCRFDGNASNHDERYSGSTTKIGLDAGATVEGRLAWAVFAPTSRLAPGALEGRYYGVVAEATWGVGVGANVLVGGFDQSINLLPLSIQGQLGANVAAGLGYMRLVHDQPARARKR